MPTRPEWHVARVAAIVVFIFFFDRRYVWYLAPPEFHILLVGLVVGLSTIVAVWIWYPSRLLAAVLALATMTFPLLYEPFRTAPSIGFWLLSIVLAVVFAIVTPARQKVE